jgi:hypothetical protein
MKSLLEEAGRRSARYGSSSSTSISALTPDLYQVRRELVRDPMSSGLWLLTAAWPGSSLAPASASVCNAMYMPACEAGGSACRTVHGTIGVSGSGAASYGDHANSPSDRNFSRPVRAWSWRDASPRLRRFICRINRCRPLGTSGTPGTGSLLHTHIARWTGDEEVIRRTDRIRSLAVESAVTKAFTDFVNSKLAGHQLDRIESTP